MKPDNIYGRIQAAQAAYQDSFKHLYPLAEIFPWAAHAENAQKVLIPQIIMALADQDLTLVHNLSSLGDLTISDQIATLPLPAPQPEATPALRVLDDHSYIVKEIYFKFYGRNSLQVVGIADWDHPVEVPKSTRLVVSLIRTRNISMGPEYPDANWLIATVVVAS